MGIECLIGMKDFKYCLSSKYSLVLEIMPRVFYFIEFAATTCFWNLVKGWF